MVFSGGRFCSTMRLAGAGFRIESCKTRSVPDEEMYFPVTKLSVAESILGERKFVTTITKRRIPKVWQDLASEKDIG